MAKDNPLEKVFEKLMDVLQIIEKSDRMVDKVPPEVVEQLNLLRSQVENFGEVTDTLFRQSGIDTDKIMRSDYIRKNLSAEDQRLINRMEGMRMETRVIAEKLRYSLRSEGGISSPLSQIEREKGPPKKQMKKASPQKKKRARQRRKKFRRIGGDGWMSV